MRTIGITGGIGSGKTKVLMYLNFSYRCKVIVADEIAHIVKEPGQICYRALIDLLGEEVLDEEGYIDKEKMSDRVFNDNNLLNKVNAIIHPAVQTYIKTMIAQEQESEEIDFLVIEAALLIEAGYIDILDEIWYVYSEESVRIKRLIESRGFTKEKINTIMASQLSEEEFRKHCGFVIDNSETLEYTYQQIDEKLRDYLWQK